MNRAAADRHCLRNRRSAEIDLTRRRDGARHTTGRGTNSRADCCAGRSGNRPDHRAGSGARRRTTADAFAWACAAPGKQRQGT